MRRRARRQRPAAARLRTPASIADLAGEIIDAVDNLPEPVWLVLDNVDELASGGAGSAAGPPPLGPQLREYDGDAAQEEFKFAARHATAYERVCVVSDESWLRSALRLLSVLVPGKIRGFPAADLADARNWVAEGLDEQGDEQGRSTSR